MDSETWLDKATRLQRSLARPGVRPGADDGELAESQERIRIALWLRREFDYGEPTGANVAAFEIQD